MCTTKTHKTRQKRMANEQDQKPSKQNKTQAHEQAKTPHHVLTTKDKT